MRKNLTQEGKWKTARNALVLIFSLFLFAANLAVRAEYYSPSDSVALTIGTVSIGSDSVQNCDSIRIKWWRLQGGWTYVGTKKLTSSVEPGFYATNIKASDASDHTGNYIAQAIAYKFDASYTDIKTWCWTVTETFDSLTNAITGSNKANFRADVSDLLSREDSSLYMRTDWNNIKNPSASVNLTQTRISGVEGEVGYLAGDDQSVVKDACAGAHSDSGWSSSRAERLDSLLLRPDSSLYMRTDWDNVKNQDAGVNLSFTRIAYVDSVDSVTQTFSAVCDTESIARATWNDDIIPQCERRIQYADSLGEEVSASVDTSQIKVMNENNLWGAFFIWNHSVRTLTSGTGSGANGVVIRCRSSSDSSAVAFAQIQVLDSTESSTLGLLTTDSQGRGYFALDNGIFCVRIYKPGWQFCVPETLKVDGDEDTTYYAASFDPGTPPQASLCRVYGWIYNVNNQPIAGAKIDAGIRTTPLRYQSLLISPYHKTTLTDDEGFWYLDLYPNSSLIPADTKYVFHLFGSSGTILRLEVEVPDQTGWQLQW
jgi:hypothetical protein